jgi:hypothetical protein
MTISPEVAISTGVILVGVALFYERISVKVNLLAEDMRDMKKHLFNGTFVRKSECAHCQEEDES